MFLNSLVVLDEDAVAGVLGADASAGFLVGLAGGGSEGVRHFRFHTTFDWESPTVFPEFLRHPLLLHGKRKGTRVLSLACAVHEQHVSHASAIIDSEK
ncbi:hypothetical protein R1flu_003062 [Riccia fluitans]|uniref:Uncharacterized protein n=1 Tax=Riccia fluitans TaxID=41844 RepID=A0ABD1Y7X1_9MARC